MPVRPRQPADLPACAAALRRVHDASGYVDPHFQRLGLARTLLDTAAGAAVDHGFLPVLDVVDDSAPAIALYERADGDSDQATPIATSSGRLVPAVSVGAFSYPTGMVIAGSTGVVLDTYGG